MPQMSIIVEYETQEGREDEFAALIQDHARRTLIEEPGCLRFEVLKPVDEGGAPIPNRMMVCELYADEAAAKAHGDNPRLTSLRTAFGALLKSRRPVLAKVVDNHIADDGMTPEELNASNDG